MAIIQILIVILYVCFAVLGFSSSIKNLNNKISITIAFILVLIIVFRPENMADYYNYKVMFTEGSERVELFFQFLIKQTKQLNLDYLITFAVIASFSVLLKMRAINKMTTMPIFSIMIWLSEILIIQDMIAIRSACAASLLLWIIYFKMNRQNKWMWISIACAICCHYTSIIYLILPFISSNKTRKILYITSLIASMLLAYIGFSIISILPGTYSSMYNDLLTAYSKQEAANPFNLLQLFRCGICLLLWYTIPKIGELNKYLVICIKSYTIGCILFFLSSQMISVAFRLEELFIVTEIILIPYLSFLYYSRISKISKLIPIIIGSILLWFNITSNAFWNIS